MRPLGARGLQGGRRSLRALSAERRGARGRPRPLPCAALLSLFVGRRKHVAGEGRTSEYQPDKRLCLCLALSEVNKPLLSC